MDGVAARSRVLSSMTDRLDRRRRGSLVANSSTITRYRGAATVSLIRARYPYCAILCTGGVRPFRHIYSRVLQLRSSRFCSWLENYSWILIIPSSSWHLTFALEIIKHKIPTTVKLLNRLCSRNRIWNVSC